MTYPRLLAAVLALFTCLGMLWVEPAMAGLPPGNAITDPETILRNALPIQQAELQDLQHLLEVTSEDMRAKRWGALQKTVSSSKWRLSSNRARILDSIPETSQDQAAGLLDSVADNLLLLEQEVDQQDKEGFISTRRSTLNDIENVEKLLLGDFPFSIPEEFDALPRLLGRATVQIKTSKGTIEAIIDGYNAPLTGGAFVDLALKGFYDGLPFNRAEDFYVLQSGDPKGPEIGYLDKKTGKERHVPLEIMVPGEREPFYNETFEDLGLFKATPMLPFATLGTLGWAHSDKAVDDGSSQFFIFLYEPELTPAGRNLIDGRNAAFGYVVDGFSELQALGMNDRILSIKVIDGANRLKQHG
ncbi:MAG: peptidylprolyl isomerase [Prochlorococcus sp.]|nr:peptidylprolyl isomerase [Prochlorococcaceae cyanobacterium Fu_MAG_50]